ncbi:hypothetical protein HY382_01350 [Candidatus Curtissbacteria bacterium]|nr:hypothetical protein [Candidatus Curtissbacteria bacterium]
MRKGFAQILPILIIAVIVSGGLSLVSVRGERQQKAAVGRVLSSSDSQDEQNREAAKKAEEESKEAEKRQREEKKDSESQKGNSGSSSNKIKLEGKTVNSKTKIEKEGKKSEVEIETSTGANFKSKIEDDGKSETKIRSGNFRLEIKVEGGKVVTKVKNEAGEDVELDDEEEDELFKEVENELEDDDIEIATGSAGIGFVQKGNKVRTNFPLSVNLQTGELFVSTPAGEKVVAVLPNVAVQNMIAAGIMTRTETPPTPPADPPGGTPSATPSSAPTVAGASIGLEEFEGKIVYKIDGVKDEKFAGIVPVSIKVKAIVSAENGELLDISQGILTRLLDLFSF